MRDGTDLSSFSFSRYNEVKKQNPYFEARVSKDVTILSLALKINLLGISATTVDDVR